MYENQTHNQKNENLNELFQLLVSFLTDEQKAIIGNQITKGFIDSLSPPKQPNQSAVRIPEKDEIITPDELEKLTKMSQKFWASRRVDGNSPLYIRMSESAIRYKWGDVVDWMEKRKCSSTSNDIYYSST